MDDQSIVELFFDRNERAIDEISDKYGPYCISIAESILGDRGEAEECVNDTYLRAWNSIPPNRPPYLPAYLGKIARNLAFDRFKGRSRQKRIPEGCRVALEELGDIVSGGNSPEEYLEAGELAKEISAFLKSLDADRRNMFVLRYWYSKDLSEIADTFGTRKANVAAILCRVREKLKKHLTERGYRL